MNNNKNKQMNQGCMIYKISLMLLIIFQEFVNKIMNI